MWTPQELLAIVYAQPPMFAPGAEYYYSNTNYVLLGLIIEQLDGKSLAVSFEDRLFGPLGMSETTFAAATSSAIPAVRAQMGRCVARCPVTCRRWSERRH